jgi:hypothetical protein
MHPPIVIYAMLVVLVLGGALLVGDGMASAARRSWLHVLAFAGVMSLAVLVIFDLEIPRLGLIRVDPSDRLLVDVRAAMDD